MKTIPLLLFLLAAAMAHAENITNKETVYFDVSLISNRCNAAGITFAHKAGIAKIDFLELSDADKTKYGFDPFRYQAFKDEELKIRQQAPPPPPPVTPQTEPPRQVRVIQKVTVITNSGAHFTPFTSSPETTIRPDMDKINDARLRAVKKAIEMNSGVKK